MIDRELMRLKDHAEWRRQQESAMLKRQREAVPAAFDYNSPVDFTSASSGALNKIQARKDKRMAREDPALREECLSSEPIPGRVGPRTACDDQS